MNTDVGMLLKKARESLNAAGLLRQEGYPDFCASRAYYVMFYVAEALLASEGQSYSSHGGVLGAYGREFAKTERLDPKFHRWLIDAKDLRSTGDYGIDVHIQPEQAEELCLRAEEFLQAAEDYLSSEGLMNSYET